MLRAQERHPPRRTTRAVRNRGLHDQLHAFACAASERLAVLVESGAEIPYEVAESPGARSVLYRYKPLSDAFVRDRFPELRALPAFPEVLAALSRIEGVSGYLRVMGTSYVPAAERDRAEAALERFLETGLGRGDLLRPRGRPLRACLPRARVGDLRGHGREHRAGAAAGCDPGVGALGPRVRDIAGAWRSVPGATPGRVGLRPPGRRSEHACRADRRVAPHAAATADGGPHGLPQARHGAAPAEAGRRRAVLGGLVAHGRRPVAGGAARHVRPLARGSLPARAVRARRSWSSCSSLRAAARRWAAPCHGP